MATSKSDRIAVLYGIASAWVLSGIYFMFSHSMIERFSLFSGGTPEKSFVIAALLASTTLLVGIGWAARERHFVSNIDGSKPESGSSLDIILRYVTNTTEQYLLFIVAIFCAKIIAPQTSIWLLPVLGSWFVMARAMFYMGYRLNPIARSIGFAATFHPTIMLFVYVLFLLIQ